MKQITEIKMRMEQFMERIVVLDAVKSREMAKSIDERDFNLLKFVHKERAMYSHALGQFQWILNQEEALV